MTEAVLDDCVIIERAAFPSEWAMRGDPIEVFEVKSVAYPLTDDIGLFDRHEGIPAHDQRRLQEAHFALVGGGGLNSATAPLLVRGGAGHVTIIDHDRVEVSNLARQLFYKGDLGLPKGIRLASNLQSHAIAGGTITGIGLPFQEALVEYQIPADIFVVGVDNNACRLKAVEEARRRRVPAVFSMLSADGMRGRIFLQGASPHDACLWCALPDLDPESSMPCVSAIMSACFMVAAHTVFFVHRALMGWGRIEPFNWREVDLTAGSPETIGNVRKREDCPVCKSL